jgi:hypothetical protein
MSFGSSARGSGLRLIVNVIRSKRNAAGRGVKQPEVAVHFAADGGDFIDGTVGIPIERRALNPAAELPRHTR